MAYLKKTIIIFTLLVFSFLIGNKNVSAVLIVHEPACYCCGGSQGCTYSWKESTETVGTNCASPNTRTKQECYGTESATGSGACWRCCINRDCGYKWTTGASPGNTCTFVSGIKSEASCDGTYNDRLEDSYYDPTTSYKDFENEATTGPDVNINVSDASCDGILGSGDFRQILVDFLNIIRILAIAMVVVFSTIDFAKALIAQDSDALKKSTQQAFKRLVIAIVVFFTPILLNILLGLIGISGICI